MEKRSKFNSSRCSFYLNTDEREEKAISILNVDDSIRRPARVGGFHGGGFLIFLASYPIAAIVLLTTVAAIFVSNPSFAAQLPANVFIGNDG